MSGPACDHLQGMATPHPALRVAPDQLAAGAPGKGSDVATDAPALTLLLALASAFAFACAMIASNVGLRHMSARAGVTVSVPSAAVLFWLALPAFIDPALAAAPISALGIFLAIGLFFPAAVTLLVFESNARLGPTIAATVSCTAPLFAVAAAMLLMYAALVDGEVSLVAPIVAGYPLFTLLLSALFLGDERLAGRHLLGVAITVAGVVLLASS